MISNPKFLSSLLLFFVLSGSFSLAIPHTPLDSVGIERIGDKSFILHKVDPQETLFGISRRYQVPIGDIQNANEVLKQGLKIGQTIRIPYIGKNSLPTGALLHKVNPGETLFSISKKYGVTVDSLKQWNKMSGNDLSVGQALVIQQENASPQVTENTTPAAPTVAVATASTGNVRTTVEEKPKTVEKKTEEPKARQEVAKNESNKPAVTSQSLENSTPVAPGDWISHSVKQGETLFSLSNQYGSSVEDLITWNALSSNNVKLGQTIKVGRAPVGPSTVPVIGTPRVVSNVEEMKVEPTPENTSGGFKNVKETGQAELIEGTGGHKKYLVLHRSAPVGSIMRVKNEENDITIFARVVGTLPETGDNSKLVIKLSQAAYDQLRAINSRFPVEVLY
jgi:LysM repeat protein